jgi:hypothetical protein
MWHCILITVRAVSPVLETSEELSCVIPFIPTTFSSPLTFLKATNASTFSFPWTVDQIITLKNKAYSAIPHTCNLRII